MQMEECEHVVLFMRDRTGTVLAELVKFRSNTRSKMNEVRWLGYG